MMTHTPVCYDHLHETYSNTNQMLQLCALLLAYFVSNADTNTWGDNGLKKTSRGPVFSL